MKHIFGLVISFFIVLSMSVWGNIPPKPPPEKENPQTIWEPVEKTITEEITEMIPTTIPVWTLINTTYEPIIKDCCDQTGSCEMKPIEEWDWVDTTVEIPVTRKETRTETEWVPRIECIELKVPFGRPVYQPLIAQPYFFLRYDSPNPRIFSPQGLFFSSPFSSYIQLITNNSEGEIITIIKGDGNPIDFFIATDQSQGEPYDKYAGTPARIKKLNANGIQTATDTKYYEIDFGNGTLSRYDINTRNVVSITTAEGVVMSLSDKDIGLDIIRDNSANIRQIYSTADGLADLVTLDSFSYEIRLYAHGQFGDKNNGLYQISGTPHTVWKIENLDRSISKYDRIRFTKRRGDIATTYDWVYTSTNDQWTLNSAGLVNSLKRKNWNEDHTQLFILDQTKDSDNNLVYQKYEYHQTFTGMGTRPVKKVIGALANENGPRLETTYSYYTDSNQKGRFGKEKLVIDSTGKWTEYDYDSQGRKILEKTGIGNAPTGSSNSVRAITTSYASVDSSDVPLENDTRPRKITETVNGVTVKKVFWVYKTVNGERVEIMEIAASPNAQYGDPANPKRITVYYSSTVAAPACGKIKYIDYPNGKRESFEYEFGTISNRTVPGSLVFTPDLTGTSIRITTTHGTHNSSAGVALKTLKKIQILDELGNNVTEEQYVYTGNDYSRISWAYNIYNSEHKVIQTFTSDNLIQEKNWSCCYLESLKDPIGVEYIYTYDLLGRRISETKKGMNGNADLITTYIYDAANRIIQTIKNAGNLSLTTSVTYDLCARKTSETTSDGLTTTYEYTLPTNNRGVIVTTTLPGGAQRILERNLDGTLKSISGTAEIPKYYEYGVTETNLSWSKLHYGNIDSTRYQKNFTNMLGHDVKVEKSGYNGSIVTTENLYDQYGNKIKVDKTGEASRLYVYDELGTLIRSGLDVNGNGSLDLASSDRITDSSILYIQNNGSWWQESSTSVYGISNDAAATTIDITRKRLTGHAANVTQEQIQIDRYGNQTTSQTVVDRNNKKVTQTVTYPDSVIPSERILENALLVSEKSKSGLLYSYSYDGLERKVSSTDPRTGTSTYSYYSSGMGKTGQLQSMTDPAGHVTTYDYEETTGRLKSVKNALNQYTYYSYNSYGQQIYQWGDSVYPVALEYDSLGQKIQQKTYRSGSSWSSPNWPSSENADVTTWSYDASSGLVTSKTDAQNHSVSYTYTSDGKLQTRTWARQAAGQSLVTTYTYDDATGELLKADYSDGTPDIVRTYDRLGNLSSVSDAAGTRNFTYNSYFDLTGETLGNRTLSYTYATTGVKGRYTGLTGNHSYGYDAYGRLNQINNVSYSYTANSDLLDSVTRPNEVNSIWTYESHRDLVSSLENQYQTELRSKYAYVNDALGRRTSMSRSGSVFSQSETLSYSYNDRSEVTGATSDVNSAYSYVYSFDPIGNRLSASLAGTVYAYTTNSLNQYTAVNAVVPTYDADGNMLTNGVWSYTWNGENRLIKAENATSGMKLEFDYDYMGRRIYKKVYENNTLGKHLKFVYDGYKLIEEFDGLNGDALVRRYVWQSEDFMLDVPVSVYDAAGNKTYFYHTDANKNITELSDENGGIVAHYEYSPFGSLTASSGEYAEENPFRFSSEYSDMETGLVYYNYRYYSPELGRWLSRDPIEEQGGWNLYNIINNTIINNWDVLGLLSFRWYENWGGPGWAGGDWVKDGWSKDRPELLDVEAKNALDQCYKEHDKCYEKCRDNNDCEPELGRCFSGCDYASVGCQLDAAAKFGNDVPWYDRWQGVVGAAALGGQGGLRDGYNVIVSGLSNIWNFIF